jgi:hypothetical protein
MLITLGDILGLLRTRCAEAGKRRTGTYNPADPTAYETVEAGWVGPPIGRPVMVFDPEDGQDYPDQDERGYVIEMHDPSYGVRLTIDCHHLGVHELHLQCYYDWDVFGPVSKRKPVLKVEEFSLRRGQEYVTTLPEEQLESLLWDFLHNEGVEARDGHFTDAKTARNCWERTREDIEESERMENWNARTLAMAR